MRLEIIQDIQEIGNGSARLFWDRKSLQMGITDKVTAVKIIVNPSNSNYQDCLLHELGHVLSWYALDFDFEKIDKLFCQNSLGVLTRELIATKIALEISKDRERTKEYLRKAFSTYAFARCSMITKTNEYAKRLTAKPMKLTKKNILNMITKIAKDIQSINNFAGGIRL